MEFEKTEYKTFYECIQELDLPENSLFSMTRGVENFQMFRNVRLTFKQLLEFVKIDFELHQKLWRATNNEIYKVTTQRDVFDNLYYEEELVFFSETSYEYLEKVRKTESEGFLRLLKLAKKI